MTRIESRVNLGIPDVLIAFKNPSKFVMLELKVVKRGRQVALSPHQVSFHMAHADLKCPTFILVQYHPPGTTSLRAAEFMLYRGSQAADLLRDGIDLEPMESWPASGPIWNMLRLRLTESQTGV
jgi:hypothetical protein